VNQQAAQRLAAAAWLELSGLPLRLNQARMGAWSVYRKLIELDCLAHTDPEPVQITPEALAQRCGVTLEQLEKLVEALRKQKVLRAFYPDHPQEEAVFELLIPPPTPLPPDAVARAMNEPLFRQVSALRYAVAAPPQPLDEQKMRQVVDWYLHLLSQKMNSFVLEQIEVAVRRFPLESIHTMIERAARHNLRNFGWVLKELIREQAKAPPAAKPLRNKL
jgi:hypothetical protein